MTGLVHHLAKRPDKIRFLVVCPTTVLSHWKDKVMEFCPYLDPYVYHGTDRSFQEGFEEHPLIITSYGIALRDIEMLSEFRFDLIVLDEIQAVKNKSTKTYAAVKALESACTVGLTGTPIENSVTDLKSLFDIILPGYLMSDSLFEDHFRFPIEEVSDRATKDKLSRMIQPFTLRRKKEQVLKELPPKIEDIRRCALSEDQIRFYRDVVNNQGQSLVQTLKDPDQKVPYMHIFAVLNYLKQICNHPAMLEGETKDYGKYTSGKWDLFVELLEESLGSGQKVVVFSQYVKMLELIESFLSDRGIDFATIKGHTRNRAEAVKRFNTDPELHGFQRIAEGFRSGNRSDWRLGGDPLRPMVEFGQGRAGHGQGPQDRPETRRSGLQTHHGKHPGRKDRLHHIEEEAAHGFRGQARRQVPSQAFLTTRPDRTDIFLNAIEPTTLAIAPKNCLPIRKPLLLVIPAHQHG